jgi:hypothetical protein
MRRPAPGFLLALMAVFACQDLTGPDRSLIEPDLTGPSFASQEGPSDTYCSGGVLPAPPLPAVPSPLPPGPYQNIIVPEGGVCVLINLTMTGNIKALAGSTLYAVNNTVGGNIQAEKAVRVQIFGGKVEGGIGIFDGVGGPVVHYDYEIANVTVTRDIHLSKNTGSARVQSNILPTGNITAAENQCEHEAPLHFDLNVIAGDIHVIKNRCGAVTASLNLLLPTIPSKGNIKVEDNVTTVHLIVERNSSPQNLQVFKNVGPGVRSVMGNSVSESIQCYENAPLFVGNPNVAPKREGQCAP